MGLWCFGVNKYWAKPKEKYVAEAQLLKWTNKWVFNSSKNGLILGGNYFHPVSASPVDFHPASRRKISHFQEHTATSYRTYWSKNRNYGRYSWLSPRKTNPRLLTGMPWLATLRAPPWWMLGGIPHSITVWGVIVTRHYEFLAVGNSIPSVQEALDSIDRFPHEYMPHGNLTHLPLDKMAAISQTIFSNTFSWTKNLSIF